MHRRLKASRATGVGGYRNLNWLPSRRRDKERVLIRHVTYTRGFQVGGTPLTRLGRVRPRPLRRRTTIQSAMSIGSAIRLPPQLSPPSRAITSTLSARAALPVPPATQTYEPHARAVLRRRLLYDILPLSILPVWTSTIFWKTWNVGGMSALSVLKALIVPFLPSTLLVTIFVWAFGILPVVVLRKSQLTGESVNPDL